MSAETNGTAVVPAEVDARAKEVERQVAEAREQAEAIEVRDEESAAKAMKLAREIQGRRKAAKEERLELTRPLDETKKKIIKRFDDAMAPYEALDEVIREKLQIWTKLLELARLEAEAWAENDRRDREAIVRAERERQEAEAKAKAERAAKEAREAEEERRKAKTEADREAADALAEEARLVAKEAATAESAIASLPVVVLPQAVVPAAAKPDGLVESKHWEFEVTDLAAVPDQLPDGTPLKELITGALRTYMHAHVKEHGRPPEMAGIEFMQITRQQVRA